jgi:hypothetical protein
MTVAVCFKCGEFKHGSLTPCPSCGNFPVERVDIINSVAMTDHYLSNSGLEAAGKNIKSGFEIEVSDLNTMPRSGSLNHIYRKR